METAVLVAIITGICSVFGQYMIARENKRKTDAEQAAKDALVTARLDIIEKKLDEHNGYASKFAETAERLARVEQRLEDWTK